MSKTTERILIAVAISVALWLDWGVAKETIGTIIQQNNQIQQLSRELQASQMSLQSCRNAPTPLPSSPPAPSVTRR